MGMIFNRGDDDRIEELEERIEELETEVSREKKQRRRLKNKLEELPAFMEEIAEVRDKYDITDQKLPKYEYEDGECGRRITLKEPRVAWKHADGLIVKLLLPVNTTVVYPMGQASQFAPKLRANRAIPVVIEKPDGSIAPYKTVESNWNNSFTYKIGECAKPDASQQFGNPPFEQYEGFDPRTDVVCSGGIHLYRTRQEAKMTIV